MKTRLIELQKRKREAQEAKERKENSTTISSDEDTDSEESVHKDKGAPKDEESTKNAAKKTIEEAVDEAWKIKEVQVVIDSLPEEHADMFDEAEIKNGERLGVVAKKNESFTSVCKRLKLPCELTDAYREWLLNGDNRPGLKFVESMVPMGRGTFTQKGAIYPRPDGKLWRQIRDKVASDFEHCPVIHKAIKAQEVSVQTEGNYKAEAFMMAYSLICDNQEDKPMKIYDVNGISNVMHMEALKVKVRARDCHDGITPPPEGMGGV